jgi:ribosomal protein S18 acetylase RimI-like enzyme
MGQDFMKTVRATSYRHAEDIRKLRNLGRYGFSGGTSVISQKQQRLWWDDNLDRVVAYLFYDKEFPVAYCVLRPISGKWWDSIAVSPLYRGRGIGKKLLSYVIKKVDNDVWSVVRSDNKPSRAIHIPKEWEELNDDGKFVNYRTWKGRD